MLGNKEVITDGSGNVLSSNERNGALPQKILRFSGNPWIGLEYDSFGIAMYTSGNAQTPYRPAAGLLDEEGLLFQSPSRFYLPNRALSPCDIEPDPLYMCKERCAWDYHERAARCRRIRNSKKREQCWREAMAAYANCVHECDIKYGQPSQPSPIPHPIPKPKPLPLPWPWPPIPIRPPMPIPDPIPEPIPIFPDPIPIPIL